MIINFSKFIISVAFSERTFVKLRNFIDKHGIWLVMIVLSAVSVLSFVFYYKNGLGLAYNDARSHLDIGRRVVEGLKPGIAQLGSVWLPLTHILMVPTIWNDFMWHSGLSGAIQSMIGFVATGALIYLFLKELGAGFVARFFGVAVFVANINILYLQSTAMTELLLLATMTAGTYQLLLWYKNENILHLIKSAFWIMLSTLVRYDGWFLFFLVAMMVLGYVWKKRGYKTAEGNFILFCTLGGFGIFLWFLWNQLIFGDALYFAFGPYSARAQQKQLETAGVLATKGDWIFSLKVYFYALAYNSGAFTLFLGIIGSIVLWFSKNISSRIRFATIALIAPLLFNILALYLGHSVLFIQGLSGDTWFNARYGIMLMPSIAIFVGFLVHRAKYLRFVIIGLFIFVTFFQFTSGDAVTIDDATVGSSQKNVTEVSGWLAENAQNKKGLVLISAASHDAIIFSSGLPMKKFIHEGTGVYWTAATEIPDHYARWIVMRSYSDDDQTWMLVSKTIGFEKYEKVKQYPFADIYQLKDEYLKNLYENELIMKEKMRGGVINEGRYVSVASDWLKKNAQNDNGFILISVYYDPIIFSSGLPMSRFITEGTENYWKKAIKDPARSAKWILLNDSPPDPLRQVINYNDVEIYYKKVAEFPTVKIYQLEKN